MRKVLILVDIQNVYYTTWDIFGRNFDYDWFWSAVSTGRDVVKAIAYTIDRGDKKQPEFQAILRLRRGITLIPK